MGSEWSVVLSIRLLFLHFLLLWQLGIGATFSNGTKATSNNVTSTGGALMDVEAKRLQRSRMMKLRDLSRNMLNGSIPSSLTKLHSLKVLNLSENDLNGAIPQNLTGWQLLGILDISRNKLTGPIPDSISDCQNLIIITLRLNFLSGSIPEALGTLSSLNILDLYSNSLSGHIPAALGQLSVLQFLNLDDNNLEGELPMELGDLENLQHLAVGGNNLSGRIPSYIGKWVNLTKLILMGNNFEGNLPAETFTLPNLQRLYVHSGLSVTVLRNCKINGSIPQYIGKWPQLSYLDLSFNKLTGRIPESFQTLNKLYVYKLFYIQHNELLRGLSGLLLQKNQFKPKFFRRMGLKTMTPSQMQGIIANNSLFINCGGEEVNLGKDHYYKDTSISSFHQSTSEDWAYSFSGDYLWSTTKVSIVVRNSTCKVCTPEKKIDNDFRLAPVSLTYYGLCLRKGKYIVTLHFAETLYSKGEDYSISGKRVFDVYIQGRMVRKDLNIKEIPGPQNEVRKLKFPAKINNGSLEIQLFWAGKGSLYNPPAINGPLIAAISVTRGRRRLFPFLLQKTTSLGNRVDYSRLFFVSAVVVGVHMENGMDRTKKIAQCGGVVFVGQVSRIVRVPLENVPLRLEQWMSLKVSRRLKKAISPITCIFLVSNMYRWGLFSDTYRLKNIKVDRKEKEKIRAEEGTV
ncbi:unnamed protein product [Dovyalis caffra]|uniref:non-specific serine/threonine protein kinase n=1 Tax=Dovyalis caffra TaxID=77055 RepID=A0AAV1S2P4_9ROSI|nr:unnamed protein product [Dovyalis caffra]